MSVLDRLRPRVLRNHIIDLMYPNKFHHYLTIATLALVGLVVVTLIGGWLFIETADFVSSWGNSMGFDKGLSDFLVGVVVVGIPVALAMAWAVWFTRDETDTIY